MRKKKYTIKPKYRIGTKLWKVHHELFDDTQEFWEVVPRGKVDYITIDVLRHSVNIYYVFEAGNGVLEELCFDSKEKAIAECKRRNALLKKQGKLWSKIKL